MKKTKLSQAPSSLPLAPAEIIKDFRLACLSRQASLLGRKEVLSGKAKFGIFGDGKEVAQLAMARSFMPGDWRSGYYRDQTFMFAIGASSVEEFFAQLYANPSSELEPASAGRQMNSHFASHLLDSQGQWLEQSSRKNSSSDISPTGGQMARLVGLAYASKLYRQVPCLQAWPRAGHFSNQGREVAFGTIGNASTSEGLFWESINAAGVLQIPLALSIWDDGYGISVPSSLQTTKGDIFKLLQGFASEENLTALSLYQVKGYDYFELLKSYREAINQCRETHSPCVLHVTHLTQPQGHSTSGSHERYKSPQRLELEAQQDCLVHLRQCLLDCSLATDSELAQWEEEAFHLVEKARASAWEKFQNPILAEQRQALEALRRLAIHSEEPVLHQQVQALERNRQPQRRQIQAALSQALQACRPHLERSACDELSALLDSYQASNKKLYNKHLYCENDQSPLRVKGRKAQYHSDSQQVDGRQIIQQYFDVVLGRDPRLFILGEDVGQLGGVNLEFEGLQKKHGLDRVTDTGIREATILGQGIGAALRGLRPIVDIQYLDYVIYALQGMSDDLATLQYRTAGKQTAPVIVRTKGHRLEGIWHTGSPMGMLLGSLRGMHLCVPRNCVQAAGMYQTLLQGDDPALVIEVLNGYRVKELCPENLGDFTVPLGTVDVLTEGSDLTLVTYGANVRVAQQALPALENLGISVELIDVQTLLPFDLQHRICDSIAKTNAVLFFDEDVPGGASAYMLQQVLEVQGAYQHLDAAPRTLCAQAHRAAYGSDGDYFSKPNSEDLCELIYEMMHEREPKRFPL